MKRQTKAPKGRKWPGFQIFVLFKIHSKMRRNFTFDEIFSKRRNYFALPNIEVSVLRSSSSIVPINNRKIFLLEQNGKKSKYISIHLKLYNLHSYHLVMLIDI